MLHRQKEHATDSHELIKRSHSLKERLQLCATLSHSEVAFFSLLSLDSIKSEVSENARALSAKSPEVEMKG